MMMSSGRSQPQGQVTPLKKSVTLGSQAYYFIGIFPLIQYFNLIFITFITLLCIVFERISIKILKNS